LHRVGKLQVEIANVGSHADANATYIVDGAARVVAPKIKDAFPKAPVRVNAQESLAQSNKNRDMEEGVGSQLE
jgi:hypothetical protein